MKAKLFKNGFNILFKEYGQEVTIFSQNSEYNEKAIKSSEENRDLFKFKHKIDIKIGDKIKILNGTDLWNVLDFEEDVKRNELICFKVFVRRENKNLEKGKDEKGNIVFNGPVYGGVQSGGSNNNQNISINIGELTEDLNKLKEIIQNSDITEIEKEDAQEALDRIEKLSKRKNEKGVLERVKDRIEILKGICIGSVALHEQVQPLFNKIIEQFS